MSHVLKCLVEVFSTGLALTAVGIDLCHEVRVRDDVAVPCLTHLKTIRKVRRDRISLQSWGVNSELTQNMESSNK